MNATDSTFWRDAALPYLEMRTVSDGRALSYGKHAHDTFCIGAITSGTSTYFNEQRTETVGAGTVVIMNPGEVHSCNPNADQVWSYSMLYVDAAWLGQLQSMLADGADTRFRPFMPATSSALFAQLKELSALLIDLHASTLQKQGATIDFFSAVVQRPARTPAVADPAPIHLMRAAEFIDAHFRQAVSLDALCTVAGLSPAHFMRAFKNTFGMSPHAYLINRRIQQARIQLKNGHALADVALELGFTDQAHFQRTFKQLLAATPGHYRAAPAQARR